MKELIKKMIQTLVYGNLWISLAAALWLHQTTELHGLPKQLPLITLVFFATFWVYNLDRLLAFGHILKTHNDRHSWLSSKKTFLIVASTASLIPIIWVILQLPKIQLMFFVHLGIISVLYALPIPLKNGKRFMLRSIPMLKIFLIAYVWSVVTIVPPFLKDGSSISQFFSSSSGFLLILERFLFILAITIPFDIRDFEQDKLQGLATFPSLFGELNAKRLSIFLLLLYSLVCHFNYGFSKVSLALYFSAIIAAILVWKSDKKKADIYYTGLLDGTLILQALLILLL